MTEDRCCPRCGSDDIVRDPESDVPGDDSDFGCNDCLYLWDEETGLEDMSAEELEALL